MRADLTQRASAQTVQSDGDGQDEDDLVIDFNKEYGIEEEELVYQTQLRKQQNMFMKQMKKDIIKKIPEYWQKRLSFRDKSSMALNELHNKQKQRGKDQVAMSSNRATPPRQQRS